MGTCKGRWAGISGYIEEGHTPCEPALEEIREETGLSGVDIELAKEGKLLEVGDEQMVRKWIVHPYRFQVVKPEKIEIVWEHIELRWIAPEDIGQCPTVPKLLETWERVA